MMRIRWLRLIVVAALAFGAGLFVPRLLPAAAQGYVQDTASAPVVSLTPDALLHFWSQQALANGVLTDTNWNTAMAQIFSAANWPGVNATSLAFLRSFFVQYVHVGVP